MAHESDMPNDTPIRVSRAYLHLKRLDRKNELLRYIKNVDSEGLFIWSDKECRLDGHKYPMWGLFYDRFSNKSQEIRGDIRRSLPDLLPSYYEALKKEIERLQAKHNTT